MIGVRAALALMAVGAVVGVIAVGPARATGSGPERALAAVRESGGHYQRGAASLPASDCSGLVSVAQSIAMGRVVQRLGNTDSLLAGRWPGAVRGATPADVFVVGVNKAHMVAAIDGVNIEATCCGQPYRVGPSAKSPFAPEFVQYHIDPTLMVA